MKSSARTLNNTPITSKEKPGTKALPYSERYLFEKLDKMKEYDGKILDLNNFPSLGSKKKNLIFTSSTSISYSHFIYLCKT